MSSRIYRHYGSSCFNPEMLRSTARPRYFLFDKPGFGLWASPTDSDFTWYEWCMMEDFHVDKLETYFDFKLSKDVNLCTINCIEDYQNLVNTYPLHASEPSKIFSLRRDSVDLTDGIDFLSVAEDYDGLEVNFRDWKLHRAMNTWDVDSLVVWNPDVVEVV